MNNYEIVKNNIAYIFDDDDIQYLNNKIKVYRFNILAKKGSYHYVKLNSSINHRRFYFDTSIKNNFRIKGIYISFIVNEYKKDRK